MYQARKVNGHVYVLALDVPSQESERSCIYVSGACTKVRKVNGHVYMLVVPVPNQESERSCICVSGACTKLGKLTVMYMC